MERAETSYGHSLAMAEQRLAMVMGWLWTERKLAMDLGKVEAGYEQSRGQLWTEADSGVSVNTVSW